MSSFDDLHQMSRKMGETQADKMKRCGDKYMPHDPDGMRKCMGPQRLRIGGKKHRRKSRRKKRRKTRRKSRRRRTKKRKSRRKKSRSRRRR